MAFAWKVEGQTPIVYPQGKLDSTHPVSESGICTSAVSIFEHSRLTSRRTPTVDLQLSL
jgi:hypothetical protein